MDRFIIGVPVLSFATIVTTSAGALTVITYGPTVVGWITSAGTAVYWGAGQAYVALNTYGGRFINSIHNLGIRLGHFYYVNKYTIDSILYGVNDALIPSIPNPTGVLFWYYTGYGAGYSLNQGYSK